MAADRQPKRAEGPPAGVSQGQVWLDAVVFLSGAAVLVLEIVGTRVIAPFYGSTVYVWSSLIAVTLASLAAGYAVGGILADRRDALATLSWALAGAGVWVMSLPAISRGVLLATGALGVAAGSLASAAALFAIPLACLGGISPLCVRLRTADLERLGREVGRVSALSTAGSVAGALATGFVLVQAFSLPQLLGGTAALLLGLAAWTRVKARRRGVLLAALAGVALLGSLRPREGGGVVLARERSFYGDAKVLQAGGRRILDIDGISNTVVEQASLESTSDYITALELLPFLRPDARRALLIGLGGGSLVGRYRRFYGVETDVVEIDPAIERLARRWFGFASPKPVFLEDGRRYLERPGPRYDLIVLDAFSGDHHPFHLFSAEAFAAASRRLAADGVFAMNVIGYALEPQDDLRKALYRTLSGVFPHVRVFVANDGIDYRADPVNLIFLASNAPLEFRRDPARGRSEVAALYETVRSQFLPPLGPSEGLLLTDAYNPLETLGAPAFRAIRKHLLASPLHRATL
ncbi:MAG: fused MFS/spermidine synthase [Elusimicrobia bacterium]|nr:fused MFS/spermidine synthase [Elusimicrobiota bacterium]